MKRSSPAALRNAEPLIAVLRGVLPPRGLLLEIASGSGEHALRIAAACPGLVVQPSDPDGAARASIAAWRDEEGTSNLMAPIDLDAAAADWPAVRADAILCVNMVHISPWAATIGLLEGAARLLPAGAPLVLYGPFIRDGVETAPGNLAFDASLKARDPAWGLRRLEDVAAAAAECGLALDGIVPMPANNLVASLRRTP